MSDSKNPDLRTSSSMKFAADNADREERDRQISSRHHRREDDRQNASGRDRRRSTSPRRDHHRDNHRDDHQDKPRRKDAGFKWKEKRRDDDDDQRQRNEGLRRGYRDQYRPRSRSRSRSPRRRRDQDFDDKAKKGDKGEQSERREKKKEVKPTAAPAPTMPPQEMMIVYVNDRLGTKKAIPCFPTDRIKEFKVIVASQIGRQPHEILLKRQGERPFKDVLTLQDYGVSNNVQLDLEVDTGD